MSQKCMRHTKKDLLDIWKRKNPKKPNRANVTKSVLCDLLKNDSKFQINSAVRKPLSIAVLKSDVKANWKSRLKTLHGYIETTGRRIRVKVIGKGVQGTATLMRTTLKGGGVLNFVEKLNGVCDEDYSVLSKFSKTFVRLLDDEEHVINDKSDHRTYDIIFKNKRALTVEPMIELAGLLLLSQCVTQGICPNFPLLYGAILSHDSIVFDMEAARGGDTFQKWAKTIRSELEWNSALFQTLVGLHVMHTKLGMTHDDLHSGNVLVHEMPKASCGKDTYLHYRLLGYDFYIPTFGKLFILIDFGRINAGNKMNIKWHRKLLDKEMKRVKGGLNTKEAYDYYRFVQCLIKSAPRVLKSSVLSMLQAFEVHATADVHAGELLVTLFNSQINGFTGSGCKDGCFDRRPKNAVVVGTYDTDKEFDKSMIPPTLRGLVKNA